MCYKAVAPNGAFNKLSLAGTRDLRDFNVQIAAIISQLE